MMMNKNLLLVLGTMFICSCAQTITVKVWTSPKENFKQDFHFVVIENPKKGDPVYDSLEKGIRSALLSDGLITIVNTEDIPQLQKQLAIFDYTPKEPKLDPSKVAYLSFTIREQYQLNRKRNIATVPLFSCDFLISKGNQCFPRGSANLLSGSQDLRYSQLVFFRLKNDKRKNIIPLKRITREVKMNRTFVPDLLLLRSKVSALIADVYSQLILPYESVEEIELLSHGDDLVVTMIEKGAYLSAIDRLQKLLAKEKDFYDLYYMGICYEALREYSTAQNFYNEALLEDPDNDLIKAALKRVELSARVQTTYQVE